MIFANRALLASGWMHNVRLTLVDGSIEDIECNASPKPNDQRVDTLLPALSNLHSHSFQRAMAGMSEWRRTGQDSFWTWRELMYRFIKQLSPEQIEAIATLVFMEMQEAGYSAVGEFHYLHHQSDGQPYDDISLMSQRIFSAAKTTGIGLTLLPVLYTYGGVRKAPLEGGQIRFGNDVDRFQSLLNAIHKRAVDFAPDTGIGIAPHSLRATSPEDLHALLNNNNAGPIHIHIAEQPKEVTDINSWLGKRPVEWLFSNFDVGKNWCLIHATHMNDIETRMVAQSGAVVGLCPITEANLGDGSFNGRSFLEAGGKFGIGSDSNINISLVEELRTLEYSQRYRDLARNVMIVGEASVGQTLYSGAAIDGAKALGRNAGRIAKGQLADLIAIDSTDPALCALSSEQILDGLVFVAKDRVITDQWSAGRHCVKEGRHISRDKIITRYKNAISDLLALI